MAPPDQIIGVILHAIGFIFHATGLYVLLQIKEISQFMIIQRLYLIYLSISEGLYCLLFTLFYIGLILMDDEFTNIPFTIGSGMYFFYILIIMLLTFDRVLNVRSNTNYLHWSHKKAHMAVLLAGFISTIITITLLSSYKTFAQSFEIMSLYSYPTAGFTFVFFIVFCYTYLIYKIWTHRRNIVLPILQPAEDTEKETQLTISPPDNELQGSSSTAVLPLTNSTSVTQTQSKNIEKGNKKSTVNTSARAILHREKRKRIYENLKKGVRIPVLLVVTFIAFIIIPDQIHFWSHLLNEKISDDVFIFFGVIYPLSPICDAIIYIFFQKNTQRFLRRKLSKFF
ncbi:uncharacterized protein [Clytia hemisphaerica]|uniref:Uncharacterized protein n=1 Tax=Clytia hemisphaerica TaxID=252671 RepID=A0A7M5X9P3_9CNID